MFYILNKINSSLVVVYKNLRITSFFSLTKHINSSQLCFQCAGFLYLQLKGSAIEFSIYIISICTTILQTTSTLSIKCNFIRHASYVASNEYLINFLSKLLLVTMKIIRIVYCENKQFLEKYIVLFLN